MNKKTVILIIVVAILAVVVIILAITLSGAANGNATPTASPTASATATESATATPTAAPTAEPIVHIASAVMTSGINPDGSPTTTVTEYAPEDMFIASVEIDTDDDDPVRFVWYFGGDSFDDETVNAKNSYANCELQSQHTWDPGDYTVEVYLQDSTDPDATLAFTVVAATPTPTPSASATASAS